MASSQAFAFLGVVSFLIAFAALALVRVGLVRLESPFGIARDGYPPGRAAPYWRANALAGSIHSVPSRDKWQLLLFANHSIREYPQLAQGIRDLSSSEDGLEALMLTDTDPVVAARAAEALGLKIPVVPVDEAFYWRYNVRVMPFIFFVDPTGIVRISGLANDGERLLLMWRLSHAISSSEGQPVKVAGEVSR